MLKNNTHQVIKIKWDGKEKEVRPGETFDVARCFYIHTSEISAIEARFIGKHPGIIRVEAGQPVPQPAAPINVQPTAPETTAVQPSEQKDEEKQPDPLVDPYADVSLSTLKKDELYAMAQAAGIEGINTKTTKEELVRLLEEKQPVEE